MPAGCTEIKSISSRGRCFVFGWGRLERLPVKRGDCQCGPWWRRLSGVFRLILEKIWLPALGLVFPSHCAACGVAVEEGRDFCAGCEGAIRRIGPPRCGVCSQPFEGVMPEFVCPNCRGDAYHFQSAVAVVRARGPVRDLIHRLKYGRELWLAAVLGRVLTEGMDDERLRNVDFDGLVPVPLHPRRLREREFNQSALLASALSKASDIPVREVLGRVRYTTTQTQLDRRGRRQNLRDAFVVRKNADVTDLTLLLVDDVLTTGSTLDACAAALLAGGASSVYALTVARG